MRVTGAADPTLPPAAQLVSTPGGELMAQWKLAAPLAAQQVGLQLMGAVDVALVGHYSSTALAGVGVGHGLVFALTVIGMGVILGLDSVVPRALGAGDLRGADRALFAGLRLAVLVGAPLTVLVLCSRWVLPYLGTEPPVAAEASVYMLGRTLGVIPFLISVAMRSYLAAHGKTRPLIIAVIGGNFINFAGDYLLIFGDAGLVRLGLPALGIPELGSFGSALATTLVQIGTALIYFLAISRLRRSLAADEQAAIAAAAAAASSTGVPGVAAAPAEPPPPPGAELRAIVHHGVPIALHMLAEVGVFATAGVLAASFGTASAGAHSVAITLASFTFSAAVGVGSATAVRVGLSAGAGGPRAHHIARHRGLLGLALGVAIMAVGALTFLLLPRQLASIFTDRDEVLTMAVPLLLIAAVFQLSDGVQAVAAGALRGAGDTRSTMWANLVGHYLVGLPISLLLGFTLGMGARGLWWGLSAGLAVTAVLLVRQFLLLTSKPLVYRGPPH